LFENKNNLFSLQKLCVMWKLAAAKALHSSILHHSRPPTPVGIDNNFNKIVHLSPRGNEWPIPLQSTNHLFICIQKGNQRRATRDGGGTSFGCPKSTLSTRQATSNIFGCSWAQVLFFLTNKICLNFVI